MEPVTYFEEEKQKQTWTFVCSPVLQTDPVHTVHLHDEANEVSSKKKWQKESKKDLNIVHEPLLDRSYFGELQHVKHV